MFRQALARNVRLFGTSVARFESKGPIDAAKDALKSVDKTVSGAAVKGIEKGGKSVTEATGVSNNKS